MIRFASSAALVGLMVTPSIASAQFTATGSVSVGGSIGVPQPPAVEVNVAPPPLRFEQQPPQPGAGYVWVAGFWNWTGTQYAWTSGQWQAPPQQGQVWEAPQWQQRGNRWGFRRGGWRMGGGVQQPQPQPAPVVVAPPPPPPQPVVVTQVQIAPPPPRFERRGPPPGPGVAWVAGYWAWNGTQYAWTPGQGQAPPLQGQTWVAPRWQHRGRAWTFAPGGWNNGVQTVVVQPGR